MTQRINIQCKPTNIMWVSALAVETDSGIQGSDAPVDLTGSDSDAPVDGSDT